MLYDSFSRLEDAPAPDALSSLPGQQHKMGRTQLYTARMAHALRTKVENAPKRSMAVSLVSLDGPPSSSLPIA